jgi:hypothetical protein
MPFRWRPMQPDDVAACANIVRDHPVVGPRYGLGIEHLERIWRRLLSSEAMTTAVYEEHTDHGIALAGFGVGIFVNDDFVRELKTAPLFWFGPALCCRTIAGSSPVLSDREVRAANSGDGLNELVWEALPSPGFADRSELYHLMGQAYVEIHRGFRFKEMFAPQAESPERLEWAIDAGGLLWNPVSENYSGPTAGEIRAVVAAPHVVGLTREMEFHRPGSWIGSLFDYEPPRIGFTAGEQRLLRCAITDRAFTNETLATTLRISLSTVKKTWLSIYDRVAERAPDVLGERVLRTTLEKRGKDKVRLLLRYLEEHPSELRPIESRRTR